MTLFKNGVFVDDPWADTEILSAADWAERRENTDAANLAIQLDPGVGLEILVPDLGRFALIKIAFPKFTDGRGYSMGRLLRSRHGFAAELRATGDILFDEMQFMLRCGFDAFEIADDETIRLLRDGRRAAAFAHFYQPGLDTEIPFGTRPWARRSAVGS